MARYRTTLDVPRPVGEVFDHLGDLRNAGDWNRSVTQVTKLSEGAPSQGTTYRLVARFMGRDVELRYATTTYDRPVRIVFDGESRRARTIDDIAIEATGSGSRVTYEARLRMRGLLRLTEPLVRLAFRRVSERAADGLRQRLGAG